MTGSWYRRACQGRYFFLIEEIAIFLYYDGNYTGKPKNTCRKERGSFRVMPLTRKWEMFCSAKGDMMALTRNTNNLW